ncbi:MAG TPA: hypothetical protein VES62_07765 [Thermoleophilaceae bacterium]|nr:hypothetical protein [Thermoleophilaceae bacterium]
MTRRRWVAAAIGPVLLAIVAVVWVIPAVSGPAVTCIDIDPVACDEAWRDATARYRDDMGGLEQIFPLTTVRVESACPQIYLQWGPFGILGLSIESFC